LLVVEGAEQPTARLEVTLAERARALVTLFQH
jgi:hypothetical protein